MAEQDPVEAFDCAPAHRIRANERVLDFQLAAITERQARIERMVMQSERRLWIGISCLLGLVMMLGMNMAPVVIR